jgi:preprotein translocase subunit SecG
LLYVIYFIHVVISIFLILVVLLQQGKGADLSVFGGGASQAAFGARGAATILHKLTVACFILFIITTLSIGILQARRAPSVMSDVAEEEAPASEAATPAPAPAPESGTTAPATSPTPAPPTMGETTPAVPAEAAPGTDADAAAGTAADEGSANGGGSTNEP